MKYSFNKDFFQKVDSEEKSYFLGLLYADGYNYKIGNFVTLALQERDKEILEKFNESIHGNLNISSIKKSLKNPNWSDISYLQINSKKVCQDLENLGCIQKKSLILEFPNKSQVPENLIHHFIRGYFDGDGSIWEGKRKKIIIKDKCHKNGKRERIIHNKKFTITGSFKFISYLQNLLSEELKFKKTNLNFRKNHNKVATLEYSGRLQIEKFYNYIYNNSKLYLKRKKEKFEKIICANIE